MNKALIIAAISAVSFIFAINSVTNLWFYSCQSMLQDPMLRNVLVKPKSTLKEFTAKVLSDYLMKKESLHIKH